MKKIATLVLALVSLSLFAQPQTGNVDSSSTPNGGTGVSINGSGGPSTGGPFDSIYNIPISLPMVKSADALREYALSIATHGVHGVWANYMDYTYSDRLTYVSTNGSSAEDILDKLFSVRLHYRLLNNADQINGYAYVYDKNDNMLFYGSSQYFLSDLEKGSGPQFNLWIQGIPILDNVESGEIIPIKEDGTSGEAIMLSVNNKGQLMFQPWRAGAPNGILVVKFVNGPLVTYDLSSPKAEIPGTTTDGSNTYKISGHYILDGGNCPDGYTCIQTLKIVETYERPTAFLRLPAALSVELDVIGIVQENGQPKIDRPLSVTITPEGKEPMKPINMNADKPTTVPFPAGNFRIKFDWLKFGQPNMLYTGPTDGGGKG